MSLTSHSDSADSDVELPSDSEDCQGLSSVRRLTDLMEADELSDFDASESEAEKSQESLYREEEEIISLAEAKTDPNWHPRQKKRKVAAGDSEKSETRTCLEGNHS